MWGGGHTDFALDWITTSLGMSRDRQAMSEVYRSVRGFVSAKKAAKMTYKSRGHLAWSSQDLKNPSNRRERVWLICSDRVIKSDCA